MINDFDLHIMNLLNRCVITLELFADNSPCNTITLEKQNNINDHVVQILNKTNSLW